MTIASLQVQRDMNMQRFNWTQFTTPSFDNGTQLFSDADDVLLTLDDTIESADNFSEHCPSYTYQNLTYLNVSCDTALDFSVPLYGESSGT